MKKRTRVQRLAKAVEGLEILAKEDPDNFLGWRDAFSVQQYYLQGANLEQTRVSDLERIIAHFLRMLFDLRYKQLELLEWDGITEDLDEPVGSTEGQVPPIVL